MSKQKDIKQSKKKSSCNCGLFADGRSLNIIAATFANIIADKFTDDELEVLALFFTVLGDALATIPAANALLCPCKDSDNETQDLITDLFI